MTPGPKAHRDGTTIEVHAKPKAKTSAVLGLKGGVIEVAVAAPPVDGAANDELIRTLAEHFGLGRRAVRLVSGASARHKRLLLVGITPRAR
jgi:uncharacterized protein (TIGR00251 family)